MHFLFKKISLQVGVVCTALLMACSAPSTTVQLNPELSIAATNNLENSKVTWHLTSQDRRIARHIIEISKGDGVAMLVNESQSSRLVIERTLREQWQQQSQNFQADSSNIINVQLIKLLAKVEQGSVSFENNADIVIKIELTFDNQIFSKTYKSRFAQQGVFKADSDKLAEQLNTQLSQILTEIIQDPELNAKLQKL
ncbi:YajG family lipoprotein [Psychromonas sp. MME2]|uniref:YajG family lipoprotein n=1 Tax=unclassified Psychromonas TaxID=2614957 RepID=UPI00339C227D